MAFSVNVKSQIKYLKLKRLGYEKNTIWNDLLLRGLKLVKNQVYDCLGRVFFIFEGLRALFWSLKLFEIKKKKTRINGFLFFFYQPRKDEIHINEKNISEQLLIIQTIIDRYQCENSDFCYIVVQIFLLKKKKSP